MRSELLDVIASSIRDATHRPFDIVRATPVSGGSINQSYRLGSRDGLSYFVKLNDAQHLAMFTAEPDGLAAITTTHTLRTPRPIIHGIAGHQSFLVTAWIESEHTCNEEVVWVLCLLTLARKHLYLHCGVLSFLESTAVATTTGASSHGKMLR